MSQQSESDAVGLNYEETKLTLGLPGKSRGAKRGFSETIDLNVESSRERQSDCDENGVVINHEYSSETKPPLSKAQVVGWPPVRASRRNINATKSCKYIKVALDGAPYLRKVDLEIYNSYDHLLIALQDMFSSCLTIRNYLDERKLIDPVNGIEYLPTYEDKDGDWMLVGDVPWKMFVESCKRVRLMKSSEAIGLSSKEISQI